MAVKPTINEGRTLEVVRSLYKGVRQTQIDIGIGSPYDALQSPTTNDRRGGCLQLRCWRSDFAYFTQHG